MSLLCPVFWLAWQTFCVMRASSDVSYHFGPWPHSLVILVSVTKTENCILGWDPVAVITLRLKYSRLGHTNALCRTFLYNFIYFGCNQERELKHFLSWHGPVHLLLSKPANSLNWKNITLFSNSSEKCNENLKTSFMMQPVKVQCEAYDAVVVT